MAGGTSRAEQLRAHREAFLLAQELGCTPKEAAEMLRKRAAREREAASVARMAAKDTGPWPRATADWDAPWMMRD